jgi:Protein of unknown function (DUF3987)
LVSAPGWHGPLCLFVAVGMDAGAHKSSVFSALTRPVADFERDQAAAALPAITETATLRRIAEQAAARAEAAAGKAPANQQEEARAEAIARAAEATRLVVPPVPRWLVDDATPEALAGLLATYGRIALLSPEGDVFNQMARRYNKPSAPTSVSTSRATPGICSRSTAAADPRIRATPLPHHRPHRPTRRPPRAGQPPRIPGSGAAGPVPQQPPAEPGRPLPARDPTRPRASRRPLGRRG